MTELGRRMLEDLQLAGFALKTQKSYVDAVQRLARYYKRFSDQLTEEEIRRFFLHLGPTGVSLASRRGEKIVKSDPMMLKEISGAIDT